MSCSKRRLKVDVEVASETFKEQLKSPTTVKNPPKDFTQLPAAPTRIDQIPSARPQKWRFGQCVCLEDIIPEIH